MTVSQHVPDNKRNSVTAAVRPSSAQHQLTLRWEQQGRNWPNRQCSQFLEAGGIRWHVQIAGQGPVVLLLHGTGAATHSWRDLLPLLAKQFTVVAVDLPGHGFTGIPPRELLSLPGMAQLLAQLLEALAQRPDIIVGHSAGAAIAAQMCFGGTVSPDWIVSLNGALLPLAGLPGRVYSPIARFLAHGRLWARLLSHSATDRKVVERLLDRTGSAIDQRGVDLYAVLLRDSGHTAAALGMMANWDLFPLVRRLPDLSARLLLVVGSSDQMVPPQQAERVHEAVPAARIVRFPECGHLLHEELPAEIAGLIGSLGQASQGGSTE